MYSFYDEKGKIKEIQRYLFLTESGNFDEATREAIMHAREEMGAVGNQEIDLDTFEFIYNRYEKAQQKEIVRKIFPEVDFPLSIYSYSEAMMEINKMLISLSSFYNIQTNLRLGNYYGDRTEKALSELSDIYAINRDLGTIDENIFIMLKKDFDMIRCRDD